MRKLVSLSLAAAVWTGILVINSTPVVAKPEYTRRTRKDCSFCHPPGGYHLNDAGKYYRDHDHSLKGYEPPPPAPAH